MPTILLNGKNGDGNAAGSGKLTFDIGNIGTSSIGMDYSSTDKIIFKIDSKASIQLTTDTKLALSGNASFNPGTHTLAGGASVEVSIDKSVDAKIGQTFSTNGAGITTAQVTIKF